MKEKSTPSSLQLFGLPISGLVTGFLKENVNVFSDLKRANQMLFEHSGVINFIENQEELHELKKNILNDTDPAVEPDRQEYGDFQTSTELADKVMNYLKSKLVSPEIVVEPTCGKGSFIVAALKNFPGIKRVYGVEIYKPYIWETKFAILGLFLKDPGETRPAISIAHCNAFEFDFKRISAEYPSSHILITGNPPWVTNAMLGSLHSTNLPQKSNFKKYSGLDAMTGKGNFDIAECITLMMLNSFKGVKGHLAFLVKNSVIKNLVFDQNKNRYPISSIEKHCIDSKKEFGVSVEAAMFFCQLNSISTLDCSEFDFYSGLEPYQKFGWVENKFVSNMENYAKTKKIDGLCSYTWRQGVKHDCSTIMEMEKVNEHYVNGLGEKVKLEEGLVYGILKSSDLKNTMIGATRKYTIITQRKPGQDTDYIKSEFPKTYDYLLQHQDAFTIRKSGIYKDKPPFSIFGIGDYSFKPFKVAISGLYKTFHFTLILPQSDKPVMLDDTCYFLGFDNLEFAAYTAILLNSEISREFLRSITFSDAKRTFTKDVLMRIDLQKVASLIPFQTLETEMGILNKKYGLHVTLTKWNESMSMIDRQNAFSPVWGSPPLRYSGEL